MLKGDKNQQQQNRQRQLHHSTYTSDISNVALYLPSSRLPCLVKTLACTSPQGPAS
jgi:hypothetical protein